MKITIWSDFACPFCYMGETLLQKELESAGLLAGTDTEKTDKELSLEFKAYQLDPLAPVTPEVTMEKNFMTQHDLTAEEAQSQMSRIEKMASRAGLEYNLAGVKVCNTFDAHRLLKYAETKMTPDALLRFVLSIFKANFTDNLQLSDHAVLMRLAVDAGLDESEVKEVLQSDRYTEEVRTDEAEAEKLDLEYIPYLRFDNEKVLQGVLSPGMIRKAIQADMV